MIRAILAAGILLGMAESATAQEAGSIEAVIAGQRAQRNGRNMEEPKGPSLMERAGSPKVEKKASFLQVAVGVQFLAMREVDRNTVLTTLYSPYIRANSRFSLPLRIMTKGTDGKTQIIGTYLPRQQTKWNAAYKPK